MHILRVLREKQRNWQFGGKFVRSFASNSITTLYYSFSFQYNLEQYNIFILRPIDTFFVNCSDHMEVLRTSEFEKSLKRFWYYTSSLPPTELIFIEGSSFQLKLSINGLSNAENRCLSISFFNFECFTVSHLIFCFR